MVRAVCRRVHADTVILDEVSEIVQHDLLRLRKMQDRTVGAGPSRLVRACMCCGRALTQLPGEGTLGAT
jgi:hypothetical protein